MQDFAARCAAERGDAVALAMGEERLTYGELTRRSGALAAHMVELGVGPGDRVALLTPKQPLAVVAMHAVLEAGGVYVPLDGESPPARLAKILASVEPRLILSVPAAVPTLEALAGLLPLPPLLSLDSEPLIGEQLRGGVTRAEWDDGAPSPGVRVDPGDPAHIIFTSGSTGQPKGVMITHAGVIAAAHWGVRQLGTEPGDRISCHAPLHFDQSTADVYATLCAGASVHLIPPDAGLDPRSLARLIRDEELTQWCSVPSVLAYMARFDVVEQDDFSALKRLLWGGEVLPTPVLAHWMRLLPHVSFTNLYGPTEATITSCFFTVPAIPEDEGVPVPIGRPCEDEELIVLDDRLRAVPDGAVGELFIAGVGLSPGYWRDEESTDAAFLPDPRAPGDGGRVYRTGDLARRDADGLFHFHGRADTQIKSRGYRIELGEIESALATLPEIRECAVVGLGGDGFEGTTIAAAYVADGSLPPADVRAALAALLPRYMLPTRWLALERLPRGANGKSDRQAIQDSFEQRTVERAGDRR